jgi:protease I
MPAELDGCQVAILVENGFEQLELVEPRRALEAAGATTLLISPEPYQVTAWDHAQWGDDFTVDVPLDSARPDDFDALLVPGGLMSSDSLRTNPRAVEFVRRFFEAGKPVASICRGPWLLLEAGVVRGRRLTSHVSLKTDLRNAGDD